MRKTKAVCEKEVQARSQKAYEIGGMVLSCNRYDKVMYDYN